LFEEISNLTHDQSIASFCEGFLNKWKNLLEFCPKIIRDYVLGFEEPSDVLFNTIIQPLFDPTRFFGNHLIQILPN
jgi:hypothetical protein